MPTHDDRAGEGRRDWCGPALALVVGVVGLLMIHHPTILSGLRRMQADRGDTRLIHYLLEHNYRWYLGVPGHERFWDPPFFYPARNVAAYSDTMLGIAPLYAAYRAAGFAPDTAFQLWTVTLSVLNYVVMLHFLKTRTGLSWAAASLGAFLFAFGAPRANMIHQQTQMTQFLSLVCIDALFGLFAGAYVAWYARAAAWLVAAAGLLAQLSSGYYSGWFTLLALGVAAILAVWTPSMRRPFLATIVRDAPWIGLAGALSALVIRPWLEHHLAASRELGPRWIGWVWRCQPLWSSWLDTGPNNWLGLQIAHLTGLHGFRSADHAIPLGIGLATTVAALAGLYLGRGHTWARLLATIGAVLIVLLTRWPQLPTEIATGALLLAPVALGFAIRTDHPYIFILAAGCVLLDVRFRETGFESQYGFGLFALVLTAAAFADRGEDWRMGCALAALIAAFSWILFHSSMARTLEAACAGLIALAALLPDRRLQRIVESGVLGSFVLFGLLTFYDQQWRACGLALAAVPAVLAARWLPIRPPAQWLPHLALVGLMAEFIFRRWSAWDFFYQNVPGASAMIFVSRVGLVVLIPAAVGFGLALDALRARGQVALAIGLAVLCVVEQATAVSSFDKAANRATIQALARRVDDRSEAFYYTPDVAGSVAANLDAMWAGIERGKPTINGYSGHTPHGWVDLNDPPALRPATLRELNVAFAAWLSTYGRPLKGAQWVGGPDERPDRFRPSLADDAPPPESSVDTPSQQ